MPGVRARIVWVGLAVTGIGGALDGCGGSLDSGPTGTGGQPDPVGSCASDTAWPCPLGSGC